VLFYGFAVFLTPMQAELGWSIAELTGAYSLALLVSGVAAIPVGRWLDRHGPRALMTGGSVAAALLVVAWASVDSLLGYYLVWLGIGLVMATVLYEPTFHMVANWFRRLRSRALTVLTFVAGLASVIYIPLASWLVDAFGWRDALLILAAILALGTIPIHALLLRRGPGDLGLEPDGGRVEARSPKIDPLPVERSLTREEAMRHPGFWWLGASFFLATLGTMAVIVHLIPYLVSAGYSRSFAAGAAGAVGLLALPGRLIFTPLGGIIDRRYITALIFVLQAVALALLLADQSRVGVVVFVVLFGAGFGAITPARAALVAEGYGPAHYGSISGVVAFCITLARSIAPVGAGVLYGVFGGYTTVLWILVALSALAALAALQARPPERETLYGSAVEPHDAPVTEGVRL
jgi:MFS family permease